MKAFKAIEGYAEYHRTNSKKNTIRNDAYVLARFRKQFGERELDSIRSDEILDAQNLQNTENGSMENS